MSGLASVLALGLHPMAGFQLRTMPFKGSARRYQSPFGILGSPSIAPQTLLMKKRSSSTGGCLREPDLQVTNLSAIGSRSCRPETGLDNRASLCRIIDKNRRHLIFADRLCTTRSM